MKSLLLCMFTMLVLTSNCDMRQKGVEAFIDIIIQDHARFENDSISIEDFMFSPLDKNVIWTLNSNGSSYELNLTDSSWTKLEKKFGVSDNSFNAHKIIKDPEDENLIWIFDFRRGLIAYNIDRDSLYVFKFIRPVSSICFLEKTVIIGTWSGVYTLDRKQSKVFKSESIAEIHINNIDKIDDNVLLINNKFEYYHDDDKVLKIREIDKNVVLQKELNGFIITAYENNLMELVNGVTKMKFNYPSYLIHNIVIDNEIIWIPMQNLKNGIIKYNYIKNEIDTIPIGYTLYSYKVKDDSDKIWFYDSHSIWCFNKKDGSTKTIQINRELKNLIIDAKYVYFNTYNSVEIFEKQYLLRESIDIKQAAIEEDAFINLIDSIDIYKSNDYKEIYKLYMLLRARFNNSKDEMILKRLDDYRASIRWYFPNDFEQIKSIEGYVIDSIEEDEIKVLYYLKVIMIANHNGKLKESLKYDSILAKKYPASRDDYHIEQMSVVAKGYESIDSILSTKQPDDVRLWRLGTAYFKLFSHVGPVTEASSINMSFPFLYLDTLLRYYPTSNYADDAEFLMLSHAEGSSHEGGDNSYNLTAIEAYKSLLEKYSSTEFKPDIYLLISRLYNECESTFEERPGYYKLALEYADKVIQEYPAFANKNNVTGLKKTIQYALFNVLWELIVKSDKTDYKLDEPILITLSIKNIDTKSKSIQLFKDTQVPNFSFRIVRYPFDEQDPRGDACFFERDIEYYDKVKLDSVVGINQTYSETWDIKRRAFDSNYEAPGKYIIKEPGRYQIGAYKFENSSDMYIPSNVIWIIVADKN